MILTDKVILVTGGTGSMGHCFIRHALSGRAGFPRKVIIFSRDETKQFHMQRLPEFSGVLEILDFRIGDIRNYHDICPVLKEADIVINAAALKHVPACEYFPDQAVMTNCLGAINIVKAISENDYPVETVVAISTDKACKPVNVMGMTKAIQERIFITANLHCKTRFIGVRYGNVLASRGSVVPLFLEQIENRLPVTITDFKMTRFLLSLDQAVNLVLDAIREANQGEIYIPDVPSATVLNIAKALIQKQSIKIEEIGIRPGEKMHEILISEEEVHHCCKRGKHFVILPMLPEISFHHPVSVLIDEFSSLDNLLTLEETTILLKNHGFYKGLNGPKLF